MPTYVTTEEVLEALEVVRDATERLPISNVAQFERLAGEVTALEHAIQATPVVQPADTHGTRPRPGIEKIA